MRRLGKALLAFWREQDANAQIVHDFTDDPWDTRFLGDLYQDLSEYAKKTYALLQTPVFVEEFILKILWALALPFPGNENGGAHAVRRRRLDLALRDRPKD